jgi:hypothetical protein
MFTPGGVGESSFRRCSNGFRAIVGGARIMPSSAVATAPRPHAQKLSASQFAVSYEAAAADTTAANFLGSSTPTRVARSG